MKVCLLFLALLFGLFCCDDGDENNNMQQMKNKKQQHMHTGSYEWLIHKMQLEIAASQTK
jgi:hypothetical protein